MRQCAQCHADDRPQLDTQEPCSCEVSSLDPYVHAPECHALLHEVQIYPVRLAWNEIERDSAGEPRLIGKWQRRGWKLWRNGEKYYRFRYLCRACIGQEEMTRERQQDYLQACKAARHEDSQTYSQMIASQDFV